MWLITEVHQRKNSELHAVLPELEKAVGRVPHNKLVSMQIAERLRRIHQVEKRRSVTVPNAHNELAGCCDPANFS